MTGFSGIASWDPTPPMGFEFALNPHRGRGPDRATSAAPEFHRRIPGYTPSELRDAPELAEPMRVGRVLLKIETERFGLPAFKILGASSADERWLAGRDAAGVTLAT